MPRQVKGGAPGVARLTMQDHSLDDSYGRTMRDLRISVTDRCNFRCLYCLPETEAAHNFYRGHWAHMPDSAPIVQQWVPKTHILSFEEIERVIRIFAGLGIQKIRLTGGEPLLRHDVERLVASIASVPEIADLAMTTNGFLFAQKARALAAAGLRRISFSLDSLDRANFKKITGRDGLVELLNAIRLARELGFHPVKVKVVSGREVLSRLQARFDLRPAPAENPSATAKRWVFADGRGEIGIIAPVSEPFCGHCNRIRLTADGKIRTCLFSVAEHDLRSLLRQGATDEVIVDWLKGVVLQKEARHHIGEPDFV